MILQPREHVGRYEVESFLGEGGLAEVYRVRHADLGSVHALKVLSSRSPSMAERMLREGRIQAQLEHAHVVRVTDLLRHKGHVALLMEYVDGEDLEGHLARVGKLPFDTAMALFAGILSGVSAAHDAGVAHRDLKPANILLAPSPTGFTAKVADFGIAKIATESGSTTLHGSMMGTPGYAAPEQTTNSSGVDGRADIFALGALLYAMLSGRSAFADPATGALDLLSTSQREPVPLGHWLADCPEHICDAVMTALRKDPDERYPDCRTMAAAVFADHPELRALAEATGGASVSLERLPPPRRPPSPTLTPSEETVPTPPERVLQAPIESRGSSRSRWALLGLLGAAAVALAAGTGWWSMGQPESTDVPSARSNFVVESSMTRRSSPDPIAAFAKPSAPGPNPVVAVRPAFSPAPTPQPASPEPVAPRPEPAARPPEPAEPQPVQPQPEPADSESTQPEPEPAEPQPADPITIVTTATAPDEPEVQAPSAPVSARGAPLPPEPIAAPPQLQGRWSGTMGRARATLALRSSEEGRLTGTLSVSHVPGAAPHQEPVSGTVDADGVVQFRGGAWVFSGRASVGEISGTYRGGRGNKALPFRFSK